MTTLRSILFILSVFMFSCHPKSRFDEAFTRQVTDVFQDTEGVFALAVKDIQTHEELLINDREPFHAASTMKVPVMIEVFNQVEKGKLSLNQPVTISNEFHSIVDSSTFRLNSEDDSERSLYEHLGKQETLSNLLYQMIISSSNLATNIIIEMVDARNVNATLRDAGVRDMQVLRGVEDIKAYQQGLNNTTTAYDLMKIFEKIGRGEMISAEASRQMIDILLDQRFREIIPARLPDNVRVAHKTGNINGLRHDAGIVFLPDGRTYVIVLLSKNLSDETAGMDAMARVSAMVYERMQ